MRTACSTNRAARLLKSTTAGDISSKFIAISPTVHCGYTQLSAIQTLEGAEAGGWSSGGRGKGFDEANNELGQKGGSSVTRMLLSRDARANKFARQKKAPLFA